MKDKTTVAVGEPQIKENTGFTYSMAKDGVDETLMTRIISDLRNKKLNDIIERSISTLNRFGYFLSRDYRYEEIPGRRIFPLSNHEYHLGLLIISTCISPCYLSIMLYVKK